jgi:hypothetical protein
LAKKGHKLILASGNTVNQFLQKQRAHKQLISDERCGIKSMRRATEQNVYSYIASLFESSLVKIAQNQQNLIIISTMTTFLCFFSI